jgi:hypothetical protein
MRIVADESVDFLIIESLRQAGCEVFSVLEESIPVGLTEKSSPPLYSWKPISSLKTKISAS